MRKKLSIALICTVTIIFLVVVQAVITKILVDNLSTSPSEIGVRAKAIETTRNLSDYANDDGKFPDRIENGINDTSAMVSALSGGPGVVMIGPGHYRFGNVTIPENVTVIGSGKATIIHCDGSDTIFDQNEVSNWALRDMILDGGAQGDWKQRKDLGKSAILINKSKQWDISGLIVRNVNGAGVQMLWAYSAVPWMNNGTITNVKAMRNYVGIRFDERSEYINASALGCWENVVGCIIHGGNIMITNSTFGSNITGMLIEDKDNGSHGSITNSLFNHNDEIALHCRNAYSGMAIDACCFFAGKLLIENSTGVNITSGIISCNVTVAGEGINRIAGNYMPKRDHKFEFSPTTILKDNFPSWD